MDVTAGHHDLHPVVLSTLRWTRPAVLAAAVSLLLAGLALPSAHSAFSATTMTPANTLTADQLSPPSGLTATQSCAATPAIAFRAATTATGGSSVVLSPPATTQAGDVLLAQVTSRYGPVTFNAPAGWTSLLATSSGGQVTAAVYWKTAVAGEPAALFSRVGGGSGDMVGGMAAYSGAHPTAPVVASGSATGAGVTATTPALSVAVTDTRVVHLYTKRQEDVPPPTGTTQRWRVMSGTGTDTQGITAADEAFTGPGTTPARASTTSFNAEWIAQTIVLRRPPGTPSVTLGWTASPSSWATGYSLQRLVDGAVESTRTVTPVGTTSTTGGTVVSGTAYTYRLSAHRGAWTSGQVTTSITPAC